MSYIGQYEIDPYINHDAKWGILRIRWCEFRGCLWLVVLQGERKKEGTRRITKQGGKTNLTSK